MALRDRSGQGQVVEIPETQTLRTEAEQLWPNDIIDNQLHYNQKMDYICATFGSSHYVAAHGVQQVDSALAASISSANIHLSTTITDILPTPSHPSRKRLVFDAESSPLNFDHVVFATQANQAKILLSMYQAHSRETKKKEQDRIDALGAFEYLVSLVVTHWDDTMLPSSEIDLRDLNLATLATARNKLPILPKVHAVGTTSVQTTHIISRTHPALTAALPRGTELMQTTNPIIEEDQASVLSEAWHERPKVSMGRKKVIPRFLLPDATKSRLASDGDLQGCGGMWFTGSWVAEGLPLLEGWVTSARNAVDTLRKQEWRGK